jgi:hypothetical protein
MHICGVSYLKVEVEKLRHEVSLGKIIMRLSQVKKLKAK